VRLRHLLVIASLVALGGCGDDDLLRVPEGTWGGAGAELVVTAGGATATFRCGARAVIPAPLVLEMDGTVEATGSYDPVLVRTGSVPAHVTGLLSGNTLTLRLSADGVDLGPFVLSLGAPAQLGVCNFGPAGS
jgi:hypothetical protein